jgi:hypothetical protein
MATIYRLWAEVYPDQGVSDTDLHFGKEWIAYQRELKRLIPPPPTVWADREFFRYCLSYIERQHDWLDQDYQITFSQVAGQLRIGAKDIEIYCPARGNWFGAVNISAKDLFHRLPKRLMGHVVRLELAAAKLSIDGHPIVARWVEADDPRHDEATPASEAN